MAHIEEIFLPSEESLFQVVKLEPSDFDQDLNYGDSIRDLSGERIGEIYRISKDHLKFVCIHCSREFSLLGQFTAHIEEHLLRIVQSSAELTKMETPEDHEAESMQFQNANLITERKNKKRKKTNIFSCSSCGKKFNYLSAMKRHMSVHLTEKSFSCTICNKKFAQRRYVRSHMEIKHHMEENFYRCGKCEMDFTYQWQLKRHLLTHDSEAFAEKDALSTSFECYICRETFETKRRVRDHMRRYWEQPFLCMICGQFCKTENSLNRHMELHERNASDSLNCDHCSKSFTLPKYLREHRQKEHGVPKYKRQIEPKELKCDQCDKIFGNRMHLRLHKRVHMEDRPHKCNICGWGFFDRGGLNRHLARHAGEKSFTCEICNKSYAREYMREHKKIHGGEKLFQCTECGKRFLSSNRLKRHMVCHSEERKYKCEFCPKSYNRSDKLLAHRRAHTGEFIYNCSICKRGFTERASLKNHMKAHGCLLGENMGGSPNGDLIHITVATGNS